MNYKNKKLERKLAKRKFNHMIRLCWYPMTECLLIGAVLGLILGIGFLEAIK